MLSCPACASAGGLTGFRTGKLLECGFDGSLYKNNEFYFSISVALNLISIMCWAGKLGLKLYPSHISRIQSGMEEKKN
jgi:hypothetical protein